jgi:hypothetical protein
MGGERRVRGRISKLECEESGKSSRAASVSRCAPKWGFKILGLIVPCIKGTTLLE